MATITGDRLRALRQELGLSQEEVAKKIGISRPAYVNYEQGKSRPVRKLQELSTLFNASTDYILGRTDIRNHLLGNPKNADNFAHQAYVNQQAEELSHGKWLPLEQGDVVLQETPSYRVLAHTTKDLPEEALQELIQIAEIIKKRYNVK